jgi:hypothetical protein
MPSVSHGCEDASVDFLRWIHHILEVDDGHTPDPDHLVEVANVGPSVGGHLVNELRVAGIQAGLVERHPLYGGTLRFTIVCFEPDQERAVEIIDAALAAQRD